MLDTGQFGVPQTFSPNGAFHRKAIYKERQQQSESERGDVGLLQSRQAPADQNRPRARHVLTPTLSTESDEYGGLGQRWRQAEGGPLEARSLWKLRAFLEAFGAESGQRQHNGLTVPGEGPGAWALRGMPSATPSERFARQG